MSIDISSDATIYEGLSDHVGHNMTVHWYGDPASPVCYSLECETCGEVIISADKQEENENDNT